MVVHEKNEQRLLLESSNPSKPPHPIHRNNHTTTKRTKNNNNNTSKNGKGGSKQTNTYHQVRVLLLQARVAVRRQQLPVAVDVHARPLGALEDLLQVFVFW